MKSFYSNGKLLLSGEYAILDGASGWAMPTKYGQSLEIRENGSSKLIWKSLDHQGEIWFEAEYDIHDLSEITSADSDISKNLLEILSTCKELNPKFLKDSKGLEAETKLSFNREWGLGTSSTLINNIANWAEVDPYKVLEATFGGSGYDIACAQNDTPITYKIKAGKPEVEKIETIPSFSDSLYFIYRGQKQHSREAIAAYRNLEVDKEDFLITISILSSKLSTCSNLKSFQHLMEAHEKELSKVLNIPTVKSEHFADYTGAIKSLGAWGGDFIMAAGDERTPDYFQKKGFTTVIPFNDMILKN